MVLIPHLGVLICALVGLAVALPPPNDPVSYDIVLTKFREILAIGRVQWCDTCMKLCQNPRDPVSGFAPYYVDIRLYMVSRDSFSPISNAACPQLG